MKYLKSHALFCAVMLLILATGAMANGQGATRTIVPINQTFGNPCTGELIQTFGSILVLSRSTTDRNGTEHLVFKQLMHTLGAVGLTTGQQYKAVGINQSTLSVVTTDGTGTFMFVSRFGYVSQGSALNWFQTQLFKITVNANGDVAVMLDTPSTLECR